MIVTFDFDSTLSRKDVQEYASELISKGIEVFVVTSRYDELHKHRYPANATNDDLYEVIEKIGLPKHNVRFCCMKSKADYLEHTKVIFHLDDDFVEIDSINRNTNVKGISVLSGNWKQKCERVLQNQEPDWESLKGKGLDKKLKTWT